MDGAELFAGLPVPLALLAEELLMLGLGVEGRLSEELAFVKVWHPGLVVTGLSICQEPEAVGRRVWFRICGGERLASVDDVSGAAAQIYEALGSLAARGDRRRAGRTFVGEAGA